MAPWILLSCGGGDAGSADVPIDGTAVGILEYVTTAPEGWQAKQPGNEMRLVEFTTPPVGDAGGGEVVVYYFGPGQGGDLEANTARWTGQFFDDEGQNPEPEVTPVDGASFPSHVVTLRGRYNRGIGMGGQEQEALPDQMLLAAVVETPSGNLFIQLHGPEASVFGQRDAFFAFVRGIRGHPES